MNTEAPKFFSGFRKRPTPIIADYRPLYKIGIISLILREVCIGNKASLSKLHLFVWALKSERNKEKIQNLLEGDGNAHFVWGVEPALNKALNFGVAEGLFALKDNKYSLTDSGISFSQLIANSKDVFSSEKRYLENLGKRYVTEETIKSLTKKK